MQAPIYSILGSCQPTSRVHHRRRSVFRDPVVHSNSRISGNLNIWAPTKGSSAACLLADVYKDFMVLAATQTSGESGKKWFQGTADAVRQFIWLFEDARHRHIENILILSGDHLYRMDYMEFVQKHINSDADISVSCLPMDESRASDFGLIKIDEMGQIRQFLEKPKASGYNCSRIITCRSKEIPIHCINGYIFVQNRCPTKTSQDTMMMGADYYQTEEEIAAFLAEGKVPIGVGKGTKIMNCIIDKNARIGKNVVITNKDKVEEADRPSEGFYIRSGITVVLKNSVIMDETII